MIMIASTQLIAFGVSSPICSAYGTESGVTLKNSGMPEASFSQVQLLGGTILDQANTAMMPPQSAVRAFLDHSLIEVQPLPQCGNMPAISPAVPAQNVAAPGDGPIVIDNDEAQAVAETIKYEELATDENKTTVLVGARFPLVICSELNSKTAAEGDPVEARLKYDLKIGDRLIANKGAVVIGHVNYCLKARTAMTSYVTKDRRGRNSGCIGLAFDEIINKDGEHLPLVAVPAKQGLIVKNNADGRVLGVNQNGQLTGPYAQQVRYKAAHFAISAAAAPAGVFSFGAVPVALGIMGAINPSFAFCKPVGENVRHRRLKGFAMGALTGVPGGFLIGDSLVKGQEAIIKPGDEFLAEFKQEFTGVAAGNAAMLPGSTAKVHGQVLQDGDKKLNHS